MNSLEVRQLIAELLRDSMKSVNIKEIGNSIHLFVEDNEFEIVVKTTIPEQGLGHNKSPYVL